MNHFTNIKIENESLYTELINNNDIKISFTNALRRIILSEIPFYAIDSVDFAENSSMLHNDMLAKRLYLMPLNYYELSNIDIRDATISLDIKNDTNHMMSIYTRDFITPGNIFINGDILFGKLKPQQAIKLTAKIDKKIAKTAGPYYSPVCKSVVTFKSDEKLLESMTRDMNPEDKKYFMILNSEVNYLKLKNNDPAVYVIELESVGTIDVKDILKLGLNVLRDKMKVIVNAINENNTRKVDVHMSNKLFESYNFLMFDEDHTMGNLLSSYILEHPNINFCGYIVPHPNDNKMIITTELKDGNTLENNKKVLLEVTQNLIKFVEDLMKEWETALTAKPVAPKKIKIVKKTK